MFDEYEERYRILNEATKWNFDALFILLFSRFESNLEYLFSAYLIDNPDSIEYGKEFSVKDLKKYSKISEVENFVHQEKLKKVMHLGNDRRFVWMKTHLKFELDKIDRNIFDKLYEIRNGIIHGNHNNYKDQIINLFKTVQQHPDLRRYLDYDNNTYNSAFFESKDDSLYYSNYQNIKLDLFIICFNYLCILGFKMILAFWTKMSEKNKSNNVYLINTHIYSLFNPDKNPHISAVLFENLLISNLKKQQSDRIDSILLFSKSSFEAFTNQIFTQWLN